MRGKGTEDQFSKRGTAQTAQESLAVWASAETLDEAWNWGWGITMRCLDDGLEAHRDRARDLAVPKYRIR